MNHDSYILLIKQGPILMVKYSELIPILIENINDQQKKVDEIKS